MPQLCYIRYMMSRPNSVQFTASFEMFQIVDWTKHENALTLKLCAVLFAGEKILTQTALSCYMWSILVCLTGGERVACCGLHFPVILFSGGKRRKTCTQWLPYDLRQLPNIWEQNCDMYGLCSCGLRRHCHGYCLVDWRLGWNYDTGR